jgi:hypothetical protein
MDLEVAQDQVEFILQYNESESLKNLNISAFFKARAGWEREESMVSRGDSMVAGAISFVFVLG